MTEFYLPSWEEIHQDLIKLSENIISSGIRYELIVAIARGGWVVGRMLSDLLGNRNVANLRIEFYTDIGKTMEKPIITQPISVEPIGKNILLCDDVADTGKSLKAACDYIRDKKADKITVVCLHKKPWSIYTPDYYMRETEKWIIYPWEYRETLNKIYENFRNEGLSRSEISKKIKKIAGGNKLFSKMFSLITE